MAVALEYLGGIPDIKKPGLVGVKVTSDGVVISAGMFKKTVIPYSVMTDVSMKTDEQISKDVTITRLLALGVFAFGAKKKRKIVSNNLIIIYNYEGLQTAAIFSGDNVPEVNSDIMKRRAKYLKKNPAPIPDDLPAPPANADAADDIPAQIKKLSDLKDSGILTDEEFETKKKELLDRM
jgi:hypothetical protein